MTIGFDALQREYVEIAEARVMPGLRMVLGAYAIPGPWREACKGVYWVKGLDYTCVRSGDAGSSDLVLGLGGTQQELIAWTGQQSAPVVVWNDELPRSTWVSQLHLAECLAPGAPQLIPADAEARIRMFGLANELLGERGLVWEKRHLMVDAPLKSLPPDDPQREFWIFLGRKYGYSPQAAAASAKKIAAIVEVFARQLRAQKARGSDYLIGNALSALDIYWAACCAVLDPMESARCPMADAFRGPYGNTDPDIAKALIPELVAHRDFIYEKHLELPVVF